MKQETKWIAKWILSWLTPFILMTLAFAPFLLA